MFKKIGEIVFAVVVCAIAAFGAVHIVTGCGSTGTILPPGHRMVLTERGNVDPASMVPGQTVPFPVTNLGGTIGTSIREQFLGKEDQVVLTTEDHLVPQPQQIPGSKIIVLDGPTTEDLLNPDTVGLVTGLVGKVLPASAAPWAGPIALLIPFLFSNFRKNAVNAVTRVVPGVQGPVATDTGKIPDVHDIRSAVIDLARAVTFSQPDPATVPASTKPLNG